MPHDYWIKETRKGCWCEKDELQFIYYDCEIGIDGLLEEQVLRLRKFIKDMADE